jgi:hypothetical protein
MIGNAVPPLLNIVLGTRLVTELMDRKLLVHEDSAA